MDLDEVSEQMPPHQLVLLFENITGNLMLNQKENLKEIISGYEQIIASDLSDEQAIKVKESAIDKLGELLASLGEGEALHRLLQSVRPFFSLIPKAKTAKIVRKLFDLVASENVGNTVDQQIQVCEESIEWTRTEKRTFLRHRLQSKLAELQFNKGSFHAALSTLNLLLREVRRLDDKQMLVEVQLLESRVYHALKNLSKSKAALVASRTAANAIYCPPAQQAALDLQSGILHAQEGDFKTGYSYFFEAFESYHQLCQNSSSARRALKYMLLCRIMSNNVDEVNQILASKNVLNYTGCEVEAMKEVAHAYKSRDLHEFERVRDKHSLELVQDPIVASHTAGLYDSMLEQHLLRVIEPYSCVQIAYISQKVKLDLPVVEAKLSQMILDKRLNGTINQSNNCLVVFDDDKTDKFYPPALEIVDNMSRVVDALLDKWKGKFVAKPKAEEDGKQSKEKNKTSTTAKEDSKKQNEK